MRKNIFTLLLLVLILITIPTNCFSVGFLNPVFAGGISTSTADPYAGYKVYAYYSGTTVEQPVYTSRDQSVQLVQPITLDSRGAYQFYCNGVYSFVVRNPDDDTTILTFDEWDFTKNAENTFSLTDGSGNTTVYFTGPNGLNYVNSGNIGVGMTVPATAIHINKPSPTIRFYDSTESMDIDVKFAGKAFEIKTVSGTTVESLLKVPVKLDEAPSGFLATPVGTIQMYAGTTAPDGWLLCQGQTLTEGGAGQKYEDLYNVIGTTYGGTGATSFNIPDLQDKYPRGKSSSFALGATCSDNTAAPSGGLVVTIGSTTSTGTIGYTDLSHTHSVPSGIASYIGSYFAGGSGQTGSTTFSSTNTSGASINMNHTHTLTMNAHTHTATASNWDTETRPNSVIVNYIIYTGVKY